MPILMDENETTPKKLPQMIPLFYRVPFMVKEGLGEIFRTRGKTVPG